MFRSLQNKGFHLVFENGYTVSVQFGPYNYCEHYDSETPSKLPWQEREWESRDAEVAVWTGKTMDWKTKEVFEELFNEEIGDDVVGRLSAEKVASILIFVKQLEKGEL